MSLLMRGRCILNILVYVTACLSMNKKELQD